MKACLSQRIIKTFVGAYVKYFLSLILDDVVFDCVSFSSQVSVIVNIILVLTLVSSLQFEW
jgi:hypothetical protein